MSFNLTTRLAWDFRPFLLFVFDHQVSNVPQVQFFNEFPSFFMLILILRSFFFRVWWQVLRNFINLFVIKDQFTADYHHNDDCHQCQLQSRYSVSLAKPDLPSSSASSFLCQYTEYAKYAKYAITTAHSIARLLPQCRSNLRHLQVMKQLHIT